MRYKYIPSPTTEEGQNIRPLYRIDDGIFISGWEVGHYIPDEEEGEKWEKTYEAMTLTPEAEEEWQRQQGLLPPTITTRMDNLEVAVDGIISGETGS